MNEEREFSKTIEKLKELKVVGMLQQYIDKNQNDLLQDRNHENNSIFYNDTPPRPPKLSITLECSDIPSCNKIFMIFIDKNLEFEPYYYYRSSIDGHLCQGSFIYLNYKGILYDCRVSLLYKCKFIKSDKVKIDSVEIIRDNWKWIFDRSLFDSEFKNYMLKKANEVGIPSESIKHLGIERFNKKKDKN